MLTATRSGYLYKNYTRYTTWRQNSTSHVHNLHRISIVFITVANVSHSCFIQLPANTGLDAEIILISYPAVEFKSQTNLVGQPGGSHRTTEQKSINFQKSQLTHTRK